MKKHQDIIEKVCRHYDSHYEWHTWEELENLIFDLLVEKGLDKGPLYRAMEYLTEKVYNHYEH